MNLLKIVVFIWILLPIIQISASCLAMLEVMERKGRTLLAWRLPTGPLGIVCDDVQMIETARTVGRGDVSGGCRWPLVDSGEEALVIFSPEFVLAVLG
jgi:hypothetical protein